jgi:hypothetical protein
MGLMTTHDKICYPFSLQAADDFLIQCTKSACEIISPSSHICINIQSKLQMASTKSPKPTAIPQLPINYAKLFGDCNQMEKNFVMLNPAFLPECTAKNTHYIRCLIGPFSERSGNVIACQTSTGVIELFSFNADNYVLKQFDSNLSEIRKADLNKSPKEIVKLEVYREHLNEISFSDFEWCSIAYDDFKILIAITRSSEAIFYRVHNDGVTQQDKTFKIEHTGRNRVKWMDLNDEHYLLVGTNKGNLIRYSIDLTDDGVVNGVKKVDEIEGRLKLSISNIVVDYHENSTIVLCSKTHSLEIFQFNGMESKLVLSKYINLAITGVQVCGSLEYLISALNAKVHLLKLNSLKSGAIVLETCSQMNIVASSADDVLTSTKYGFYGVATSRNNVLVYLSCYPQIVSYESFVNKLEFSYFLSLPPSLISILHAGF